MIRMEENLSCFNDCVLKVFLYSSPYLIKIIVVRLASSAHSEVPSPFNCREKEY